MFNFCISLASITFGSNWISYGTETHTDQTIGTCARVSDEKTYTGLQALLEAYRTKGAIAEIWTKS